MNGYMLIDTEVFDPEVFAEFRSKIEEALQPHGGRFLVRGGAVEVTEGDWSFQRVVIIEFDSFERARGFVRSPEYTALQDLRERCMHSKTMVVEGYNPAADS